MYAALTGVLLTFGWGMVWLLFFVVFPWRARGGAAHPRPAFALLTWAVLAEILLWATLLWHANPESIVPAPQEVFVGALCLLVGWWFMLSSRRALAHLTNRELLFYVAPARVRSGPYQYLMHPMYMGLAFALLGTSLVLMNLNAALLTVFIDILLLLRAREERLKPA